MKTGAELIAAERRRQIEKEGWTPEHDDQHNDGELALAAALYATPERLYFKVEHSTGVSFGDPWPWAQHWDKRARTKEGKLKSYASTPIDDRVRQLEKAGALIAAEIDRLLRRKARA